MSSDFLLNAIPAEIKRYSFSPKAEFDNDDINIIQERFGQLSQADKLIEQVENCRYTSQYSVMLVDRLNDICAIIDDIMAPYLNDPLCPPMLTNMHQSIQKINRHILDINSREKMNTYLQEDDAFNYFFTPINQALTFQGRTVHPPLFMADIIVMLTNLDEQKRKVQNYSGPVEHVFSMNGKERKISNQFTDDGKGLVSMISFTEFRAGEPLVAIDDDGASTCVLSMAEYSSLSNTTNQHILSHRPLSECNVWALATHAPTVTLGVNVPPNVRHHLSEIHAISQRKSQDSLFFPLPEVAPVFSTPSGDYFATLRPQEVNNEPTYWESVPTQSPEEAMLDRWLYSEDDPLKLRFLKGPIDLSIDQFEEARLIDAAFESKGEIQPPYTRDTMAIHRFFTHWKLETGAFTRSPELKQRISSIASPQDLLNDDLMQVPLARFIQLMKVKDAFLAKFNQYRSPLPVSNDWDAFCLLKDQVANEFNIF